MYLCKKLFSDTMVGIENNLAGMVPRCTSMKLICQKLVRQGHGQFALCTFVRNFSLKPMVGIENNLAGMVPRCTSMKLICQKLGRQGHGQFALCTFVRNFSLKPMVGIENNLAGMVTLGHRLSSILATVKPV